ncbi:MAG TPA: DeoR/GlpR transcriptional regulator [Anaerolineae bacterium]|nr:DeoR/GlpR transcriptional regulator [Anaerolineae bacterium]
MFREERIRNIIELINKDKKVYVKDLAKRFNRSESSIRLDLSELEERGLILRTHGGAMIIDSAMKNIELRKKILSSRINLFKEEKQRIGSATVDLIHDGDSILIDGGSTTAYVAQNLGKKNGLTVITSSIHLLPHLIEIPEIKIFLTGGFYFREYEELVGEISLDSLNRFKPDHTIMGIDGISLEHGLTSLEPIIAPLKRKMIAASKDIIIVSDHSKFGRVCLLPVANLQDVQKIVTDNKVEKEFIESIQNQGLSILAV